MDLFNMQLESALQTLFEGKEGIIPFDAGLVNRLVPQIIKNKKLATNPFIPRGLGDASEPGAYLPKRALGDRNRTLKALLLLAAQSKKYRQVNWLWSMDVAPNRNMERVLFAVKTDDNEWSLDSHDHNWIGNREKFESNPDEGEDEDEGKQWLLELMQLVNGLRDRSVVTLNSAANFGSSYYAMTSRNRKKTTMLWSNELNRGFYIIKNNIKLDWSLSNHHDAPQEAKIEDLPWDQAWEKFAENPIVTDRHAGPEKLKRPILLFRNYLNQTEQGIYIDRATSKEDIKLFATAEDDEKLKSSLSRQLKRQIPDEMFEDKLSAALGLKAVSLEPIIN